MTKTTKNEYDQTKRFLNKIRKLNNLSVEQIKEQLEDKDPIDDGEEKIYKSVIKTTVPSDKSEDPDVDNESNWETPDTETQQNWEDSENNEEKSDFDVINNVEVVINSTDKADLQLKDEEKGKISQLIDDFRKDVYEIAEFGKLNIYDNSAKLDGNIGETNLNFTLSAGDDNGVYLHNMSMMKLNNETAEFIRKLQEFQPKFNDVLNEIIANRQQN